MAAWQKFGGGEALENLRLEGGIRLGDHPAIVKMFAAIGRTTMEATVHGMSSDEKSDLAAKHREARAKSIDAGMRGDREAQQKFDREANALAERAYGTEPYQGRAA